MQVQGDAHMTEREFATGDCVFVKLQAYAQQIVQQRTHHNLSYKYFDPY
jgi:hypothetical protein